MPANIKNLIPFHAYQSLTNKQQRVLIDKTLDQVATEYKTRGQSEYDFQDVLNILE